MKSKSRNVNGYVKTVRALQVIAARMQKRDEAHAERQAPDRRRLCVLQAKMSVQYAKLNGAQIAEARKLTTAGSLFNPTPVAVAS